MKKLLLILSLLFTLPAVKAAAAPSLTEIGSEHETATATTARGAIELAVSHDAPHAVRFMVFSITGQLVKNVEIAPGDHFTLELPDGYYIVKTPSWSKRVVLRH